MKSRENSENDGKNLTEMYISSLKCGLIKMRTLARLVLLLSFPKNVPHFLAILRPLERRPLRCRVSRAYRYATGTPMLLIFETGSSM